MKDIKTLIEMFRKVVYIIPPRRRKQSILVFLAILLGAVFELLGVTAVLPFIQAVLTPESIVNNPYLKPIFDSLQIQSADSIVLLIGIGVIIVYLVKNLYLLLSKYLQIRYRNGLLKELSTQMLNAFMMRPYTFFLDSNSSGILRVVAGEVESVNSTIDSSFKILVEGISCVLIGLFIFWTDALMAAGVLLIAGTCFIAVTMLFKRKLSSLGQRQREIYISRNIYASQALTGIKEITVTQRIDYFVEAYESACEDARRVNNKYELMQACPERIIEAVCISGILGMVCLRLALGVDTASFVPKLGTFAVAAFRILPSISRMLGDVSNIVFQRPTVENVYHCMAESEKYVKYVEEYRQKQRSEKWKAGRNQCSFESQLEIKEISWQYPHTQKEVIKDLSLTIHKGEAVALIGASGAGKTTLADIILGLLRPQKGMIYMDGVDILTMSEEWARIVGYVPQSVFLIDDTIRNNIAFGIKEENIDDEIIWDVLEQSQMKAFVESLPDGLNTRVGERGVKFSGGQKQRIAIARALYNNPDILVLDEATSALDTETETAVMEAIDALQGHKTLIIVAHRLTTVRNCDKIYEVKDGKAVLRDKREVLG